MSIKCTALSRIFFIGWKIFFPDQTQWNDPCDLIEAIARAEDDRDLRAAEVNSTDDDGTPLNEKNEEGDLDIPGASLDDDDEQVGEEDEENNAYSTPD